LTDVYRKAGIELRLGDYRDVLADVEACDAVITDPPYSLRQHEGYRTHADMVEAQRERSRRRQAQGKAAGAGPGNPNGRIAMGGVPYAPIDEDWARSFVARWSEANPSWWVIFSDHVCREWWEASLRDAGWYVFAPLAWVKTGGTPRFQGDGPANSLEWITVARPKRKTACGSLPGYYLGDHVKGNEPEKIVTGQKPVWLMRSVIADYTSPAARIVDPCAGGGTTALAAALEGRTCISSEIDPTTYTKTCARLERTAITPPLFVDERPTPKQEGLF
jgi:DNA modification methylase